MDDSRSGAARRRIAVDMDDVLVDTATAQRAWFQAEHGLAWTDAELAGRTFAELAPAAACAHLERVLHDGRIFADLPEMPGARETVEALAERYDVYVATAAMEYPGSFPYKFAWLRAHLPFLDPLHVVFCGDKGILAADFLVDDNARHFRRFRGRGVLFSAHHNLAVSGCARVSGWADVRRVFLGERPPDEVLDALATAPHPR